MYLDACGAKRKEALGIFAEVEDQFLRVESAMLRFVDLLSHQIENSFVKL